MERLRLYKFSVIPFSGANDLFVQVYVVSFRQNRGHREGAEGGRMKDEKSGQVRDLPGSFSIEKIEEKELMRDVFCKNLKRIISSVFFYCIF